jgi:biopolymer transport protein ExbB
MIQFVGAIARLIAEGNVFMLVNVGVLVLSLAVAAERMVVVVWRMRVDEKRFLDAIEKSLSAGNPDKALRIADSLPGVPLARMVRAALQAVPYGPDAVALAIDQASAEATSLVKRRVDLLWSLANIATLLGLIGTISGLISAFLQLGAVAGSARTDLLSAGISEAMNNTAFGLLIAVSCIAAHAVIAGSARRILDGVEIGGLQLQGVLGRLKAPTVPAASAAVRG